MPPSPRTRRMRYGPNRSGRRGPTGDLLGTFPERADEAEAVEKSSVGLSSGITTPADRSAVANHGTVGIISGVGVRNRYYRSPHRPSSACPEAEADRCARLGASPSLDSSSDGSAL